MEREKKPGKVKTWFKRNADEIKAVVAVTGVAIASYIVGHKVSEFQMACGLKAFHENGIIEFIDPLTNLEVSAQEACEVVKRTFKK